MFRTGLFFFGVISCLYINSPSQTLDYSLNPYNYTNTNKSLNYPRFNVHLGIGLAPGGRIGINVRILNSFSAEIGIGKDLSNFVALSDEEDKYSFGINYHFKKYPLHINAAYVYANNPNAGQYWIENPRHLFAINFGYMNNLKGITPFARGGLYYEIVYNNPEKRLVGGKTFFNLDLGIGWTF